MVEIYIIYSVLDSYYEDLRIESAHTNEQAAEDYCKVLSKNNLSRDYFVKDESLNSIEETKKLIKINEAQTVIATSGGFSLVINNETERWNIECTTRKI